MYNTVFDYNFAVDEEKLGTVCDTMTGKANEVRELVDSIYNIINDDLSNYWKSTAYDNFRDTCSKYRVGLNELANMIELFGNSAQSISEAAGEMFTGINSKF